MSDSSAPGLGLGTNPADEQAAMARTITPTVDDHADDGPTAATTPSSVGAVARGGALNLVGSVIFGVANSPRW